MTDRLSAYGHIKRTEIKGALPPAEQEELEHLEGLPIPRSNDDEDRIRALWAKAFRDHVPPKVDPLFDLAAEVGEQMRARQAGDSSEPRPGQP